MFHTSICCSGRSTTSARPHLASVAKAPKKQFLVQSWEEDKIMMELMNIWEPPVYTEVWPQGTFQKHVGSFQSLSSFWSICHMEQVPVLSEPFEQINHKSWTIKCTHSFDSNVCCRIWFNHQSVVFNEWWGVAWMNRNPKSCKASN